MGRLLIDNLNFWPPGSIQCWMLNSICKCWSPILAQVNDTSSNHHYSFGFNYQPSSTPVILRTTSRGEYEKVTIISITPGIQEQNHITPGIREQFPTSVSNNCNEMGLKRDWDLITVVNGAYRLLAIDRPDLRRAILWSTVGGPPHLCGKTCFWALLQSEGWKSRVQMLTLLMINKLYILYRWYSLNM